MMEEHVPFSGHFLQLSSINPIAPNATMFSLMFPGWLCSYAMRWYLAMLHFHHLQLHFWWGKSKVFFGQSCFISCVQWFQLWGDSLSVGLPQDCQLFWWKSLNNSHHWSSIYFSHYAHCFFHFDFAKWHPMFSEHLRYSANYSWVMLVEYRPANFRGCRQPPHVSPKELLRWSNHIHWPPIGRNQLRLVQRPWLKHVMPSGDIRR